MDNLRRQLDELKIARRTASAVGPRAAPVEPVTLEAILGGSELADGGWRCWQVETPFERVCNCTLPGDAFETSVCHSHNCDTLALDPARSMLLDIETGGFSGTGVFLIGLVRLGERPLRVTQFLARDYPEEESILHALAGLAAIRDTWITFNGKSFDEPFLRDRATLHRVRLRPPAQHLDLLHVARRMWRGRLPNCRLGTLEQHILQRTRVGDVPSSQVPDLFHHFYRTGNARPLAPVLEHNRIDLVSCAELLEKVTRAVE